MIAATHGGIRSVRRYLILIRINAVAYYCDTLQYEMRVSIFFDALVLQRMIKSLRGRNHEYHIKTR